MDWKIRFEAKAKKQLGRLSPEIQVQITSYMLQRVAPEPDPRLLAKHSAAISKATGVTV